MTNQDRTEQGRQIVEWMPEWTMQKSRNFDSGWQIGFVNGSKFGNKKPTCIYKLWKSLDLQRKVLDEFGINQMNKFTDKIHDLMLEKTTVQTAIGPDGNMALADPETRFQAIHQTIEGCE